MEEAASSGTSALGIILVIDDRGTDRELLAMLLRHAGYRVLETASGEEALELVRAHRPSLVISDILMPEMNGWEFVRALRSNPDVAGTQVVVCTASFDEREVRELAVACGVVRLLPKPLQHEDVLATVRELVGRTVPPPPPRADFDAEHARVMSDKLVEKVAALEQTEEELRRSEELYRLVAENSSDVILLHDLAGRVVYVSPAAERILGYPPEELVGLGLDEIVRPDDGPRMRAAIAETVGGSRSSTVTVSVRHRQGSWVRVEGVGSAIRSEAGWPEMILVSLRDVSERERAEEERARLEQELRQAQKMEAIARLSGGVAHDFNNMLAAINGFAELLLRPASEIGEAERGQIEQIRTAGERASSLTQQLLAFSRRQVIQPRLVDLNEVVAETEAMLRRLIGENIELVTRLEPELPRLYTDPNQLAQVVLNLAVNARDAMPGGGRLTIETGTLELAGPLDTPHVTVEPGSYVHLSVTDTGVGIDAATSARLFEPFFTTKGEGKGTGLGLSTVYGIVTQFAGHVWAESAPGFGASFNVLLPQAPTEAFSAGERERGAPAVVAGSGTVLLVEDEKIVRNAVAQMLLAAGYRVLAARDGEEALITARAHGEEIDVVMTDIVMPKMGGTELAEALGRQLPAVPVLYTSGYVVDELTHQGIPDKRSFIQKPFSLEELRQKLSEVMAAGSR